MKDDLSPTQSFEKFVIFFIHVEIKGRIRIASGDTSGNPPPRVGGGVVGVWGLPSTQSNYRLW